MHPSIRHALFAVTAVGVLAGLPSTSARAQGPGEAAEVEISTFHEALEPHGRWFAHPQYGYVWAPDVDADWRPYTRGRWVYTEDHGWYWEADEPWGWAAFHYGRWFLDDNSGWVWVPGTDWAPAWVAWRHSDDHVGWAPLPPEAEWRYGSLAFSERYYDSPRFSAAWCFAPIGALGAYSVYRYILPPARNYEYVRTTRWIPSHSYVDRRIFVTGIDRSFYERRTRRPLVPVRVVSVADPRGHGGHRGAGGVVHAYRPRINLTNAAVPPPRLQDQPNRDWRHGRPGLSRPSWLPGGGRPDPKPGFDQRSPAPVAVPGRDRPEPKPDFDQRRRDDWRGRAQPQAVPQQQPSDRPTGRPFGQQSAPAPQPSAAQPMPEKPRVQPTQNFNQGEPRGASSRGRPEAKPPVQQATPQQGPQGQRGPGQAGPSQGQGPRGERPKGKHDEPQQQPR